MAKLQAQLQKLKQQKIDQRVTELRVDHDQKISELEIQLDNLKTELKIQTEQLKNRLFGKLEFEMTQRHRQQVTEHRTKSLKSLWQEVADQVVTDSKSYMKFLESQLKSLPAADNWELLVDEDIDQLKKLTNDNEKITVAKSKQKFGHGFVAASDNFEVNAKWKDHLDATFDQHVVEINKIVGGDDVTS